MWLLTAVPVLVSGSVGQVEALGVIAANTGKFFFCPYTPRKNEDTNQKSSTLLLSQNIERKVISTPSPHTHYGKATGMGAA